MIKGGKLSEETKKKVKENHSHYFLGKKFSKTHRENISKARKGFKMSEEQKIKLRERMGGENHWRWMEDRSQLKIQDDRRSSAVNEWRRQVYERDGWKCRISNKECCGRLEAHHILNWEDFPELRYEVNNGVTLCHVHHPRGREKEKMLSPYLQNLLINETKI
jgi:hypothetical protein